MKNHRSILTAILATTIGLAGCSDNPINPKSTQTEKASYAIGYSLGRDILSRRLTIDRDVAVAAFNAALKGKQPTLREGDMQQALLRMQKDTAIQTQSHWKEIAESKMQHARAFLEANKEKEGIMTLPSGVQYKVIRAGKGASPQHEDSVMVAYRGLLTDGTVFDSSLDRKEGVEFELSTVIPGWADALQHMTEGAKWTIYIPPQQGYGEQGAGNQIGPNEVLVFEVELLKVLRKK